MPNSKHKIVLELDNGHPANIPKFLNDLLATQDVDAWFREKTDEDFHQWAMKSIASFLSHCSAKIVDKR